MKNVIIRAFFSFLFLTPYVNFFAQETALVVTDARIRVQSTIYVTSGQIFQISNEKAFEGIIKRMDSDTLLISADGYESTIAIPIASLNRIDIKRTKRNTGKGALIGLGIGGAVGAIVGVAILDQPGPEVTAVQWALMGGGVGGSAGLLIGTIIGLVTKSEKWQNVPLPF